MDSKCGVCVKDLADRKANNKYDAAALKARLAELAAALKAR